MSLPSPRFRGVECDRSAVRPVPADDPGQHRGWRDAVRAVRDRRHGQTFPGLRDALCRHRRRLHRTRRGARHRPGRSDSGPACRGDDHRRGGCLSTAALWPPRESAPPCVPTSRSRPAEQPADRVADPLRVVIAEDNYLVGEGTRRLLEDSGEVEVVAAVGTATELLDAVRRSFPDAVLTDIRMPPGHHMEGIEAAYAIGAAYPRIGIAVLSQHTDETSHRPCSGTGPPDSRPCSRTASATWRTSSRRSATSLPAAR